MRPRFACSATFRHIFALAIASSLLYASSFLDCFALARDSAYRSIHECLLTGVFLESSR